MKVAIQVFYAKFLSIMEYGSVIWSTVMKPKDWERLEVKMRYAMRCIMNVRKCDVHNVVIHGELGIPSFEGLVRKIRLLWWRELEEIEYENRRK